VVSFGSGTAWWHCNIVATYAYSGRQKGHGAFIYCARGSSAVSVLKAGVYFLKASMEADLAKEVGDGVSGVKRAAEWDPGLRCAKKGRQVCW